MTICYWFKEIATLTATSAFGVITYRSFSIGSGEDLILQAGKLDQAPIIHQVMLGVTLMRKTGLFFKECQCFTKSCSLAWFKNNTFIF